MVMVLPSSASAISPWMSFQPSESPVLGPSSLEELLEPPPELRRSVEMLAAALAGDCS